MTRLDGRSRGGRDFGVGWRVVATRRVPRELQPGHPAGARRSRRLLPRVRHEAAGGGLAAALGRPRPPADLLPPPPDHRRPPRGAQDAEEPAAAVRAAGGGPGRRARCAATSASTARPSSPFPATAGERRAVRSREAGRLSQGTAASRT